MSLNKYDLNIYNINNTSNELFLSNTNTINFSGLKNNIIKNNNVINSNLNYRKYLTKNADKIIGNNSKLAQSECGYSDNMFKIPEMFKNNNGPYLYTNKNFLKPKGYETSDLKESFLKKQFFETNKKSYILNNL